MLILDGLLMSKLTNIHNLPEAIFRAVERDPYDKGNCDFSVTGLIVPSRIHALRLKHKDEISEDVSDRIFSLLGQAVHVILERSNNEKNAIAEKRYFAKFGQYTVSAQVDSLELVSGILQDYKCTTAWGFMNDREPKPEYLQQLNIQAEILRRNNIFPNSLKITGILRDWQIKEAANNPGYPQIQIATLDIPMWTRDETEMFIMTRIASHLAAEKYLPKCTDSEKWATPTRFAIMKGTNKRAVKLVDSLSEANDYVFNYGAGHRIESRPGEVRRCKSYCSVNKFCTDYQSSLTNKQG